MGSTTFIGDTCRPRESARGAVVPRLISSRGADATSECAGMQQLASGCNNWCNNWGQSRFNQQRTIGVRTIGVSRTIGVRVDLTADGRQSPSGLSLRQRRNTPTERLGDLPLEARVTKHPSAVGRGPQRINEIASRRNLL